MSEKYADFGARLCAALQARGIHKHSQQVRVIAEAAEVSPSTARRYLARTSTPRMLNDRERARAVAMADAAGVLPGWLIFGERPRTREQLDTALWYSSQPPELRRKLRRAVFKLVNQSPRANRLMEMYMSGQIGGRTFLDLV